MNDGTAGDCRVGLSLGFYDRDGRSAGGEDTTLDLSNDSDFFLYGEIYDRREVRGPTRASVTITSRNGTLVYETPFEPMSSTAGHHAYIPLKELGPGSYLAAVEVVSVSPRRTAVRRSVAFTISQH